MSVALAYGWRSAAAPQPQKAPQGLALQWWLKQLDSPTTRSALLLRGGPCPPETSASDRGVSRPPPEEGS
jgi:hypothetical protein